MLGNRNVVLWLGLPTKHVRVRFVADYKGRLLVNGVLLDAIDLDGRMIGRRAKQMPRFQISRVNVCPRIDDERGSASGDFERERIVVPVRAAAIDSLPLALKSR